MKYPYKFNFLQLRRWELQLKFVFCMIKYKIKRKIMDCEKMESVTSHDLYPPSPLSQTVTLSQTPSPPLERDILYGRPLKSWDRNSLTNVSLVCGSSEKISGPTGVVAEMLKAVGETGTLWMTEVCNAVMKDGKVPEDWSRSWMANVYKVTKVRMMHQHVTQTGVRSTTWMAGIQGFVEGPHIGKCLTLT